MIERLIERLIARLIGGLIKRLIEKLIERPIERLIERLIGRLIERLIETLFRAVLERAVLQQKQHFHQNLWANQNFEILEALAKTKFKVCGSFDIEEDVVSVPKRPGLP